MRQADYFRRAITIMSKAPDKDEADELFFDQLKDQFVFFYAATLTAMDGYKKLRASYRERTTDGDGK